MTSIGVVEVFANNQMENEGLFEGDIAGIDPYALTKVEFLLEFSLFQGNVKDILQEAFDEYESKTCLKFKERTPTTNDYILFTIVSGCWSSVGRKGGEQEISLSEGCHDKVSAVHEIGHAIGLWHEHSRSDRDEYLEILWGNIKTGSERNFLKLKPWENNLLGEKFDYKSIMLYGEYAFAKDRNSMTMKPREENVTIGLINNKPGLSDSDVRRINKMYECNDEKRPPPPEVPDFTCDFEADMCGMENADNNYKTQWKIENGTLGGRDGSYIFVNAADASYRKIRLITPFFGAYGRKKACFNFDTFFNGGGAVSLDISVHFTHSSKLIMKHIDKKDEWQSVQVPVDLEGDVKFTLDAKTRKSNGEGIIALDNIRYQWKEC
nr:zinc metalloproteinase nas-6 [Parasteatoda tepidariorum]